MAISVKKFALGAARASGIFAAARELTVAMPRILMYHNFTDSAVHEAAAVSVDRLREQFRYLKKHFNVVSLQEMIGQWTQKKRIDDRTAVLTIDDGRRNCYEFLFPLLKEFNFPATFYVVSSSIHGEDWLWTDKVLWLSEQQTGLTEILPDNLESLFAALNSLRPEVRNARIRTLAETAGMAIPREAPRKYASCSWDELREMAGSGLVEIGSHTASHPILASITDEESWNEIADSKAQLEAELHQPVQSFCFPNGKPGDYRPNQVGQVRDAGYSSAVVTRFGFVTQVTDLFELPRIGVAGDTQPLTFRKYVDGLEYYQARLRGIV